MGQLLGAALLIGIVIALVMRGIFIFVGAAAINQFSWVFYIFGLFLVWTAYKLAKDPDRVVFARTCGVERIFNVLVAASN